ncbi:MAG: STAS domain-containing protein [Candidatus Muirbacterium halophilum]|nr:STAS domain-containing protein [Candidatus Muirbacterium halophilum]MCK9475439.1 STAS domain-containing protein [Candidatus Muirbacterium halophilum]
MLEIIKNNINENLVFIKLNGKLIYDTEEDVNLTFESIIANSKDTILDVSELNYVNSSGLGIFINFLKSMKSIGRRLIILNPSIEVKTLFEITSLDKMFDIVNTIDEAKEKL